MQPDYVAYQGALVKKNFAPYPATQLAMNVLLTLSHASPIVNGTNASHKRRRSQGFDFVPQCNPKAWSQGRAIFNRANILRNHPVCNRYLVPLEHYPHPPGY